MTAVDMRDSRLGSDGAGLFVRSWTPANGRGRAPIVLFHDSLGCVQLWRRFPETLAIATGRPVIAYDRLGFGRSDPHPGRLALDFVSAEARAAIPLLQDGLRFDAFVACGHSVGGGMAVEAAARFPAHCEALITMSAQAFVDDRILHGIREAKAKFASEGTISKLSTYHGAKAGWVFDSWTETWLDPRFRNWSLDDALGRIACPVLAIHGDLDEYGSEDHPRRIAGTGGRAELLSGIGHVPHREAEESVAGSIARFLVEAGS
jgi:pimeloyl-ACP methyl ester carboxylesterase